MDQLQRSPTTRGAWALRIYSEVDGEKYRHTPFMVIVNVLHSVRPQQDRNGYKKNW
jgi:hypothetical protein